MRRISDNDGQIFNDASFLPSCYSFLSIFGRIDWFATGSTGTTSLAKDGVPSVVRSFVFVRFVRYPFGLTFPYHVSYSACFLISLSLTRVLATFRRSSRSIGAVASRKRVANVHERTDCARLQLRRMAGTLTRCCSRYVHPSEIGATFSAARGKTKLRPEFSLFSVYLG